MKLSQLFTRTLKENPKDEVSINAQFLERAGFIYKNSAGIYSYLPLGWRVIQKIAQIIREEMNYTGASEMFMPALHDKHYLMATGRWDVDVVFKVTGGQDKEPSFNISWTHEEIATEIASRYVSSYKDLPFAIYQIQTKFRNEPRAKSGLLRGREFMMKDLYSFHATEEQLFEYYERIKIAYLNIFKRCGLKAYYTLAAGGDFMLNNSHEFQVVSDAGEDTIYVCDTCEYAENKEISKFKEGDSCSKCDGHIKEYKSIEVGNIFPLGTKYSKAFNLQYTDEKGDKQDVVMGSYGIGLGRLMGTVVETMADDKGIIWPESIAPFRIHLIALEGAIDEANELYNTLVSKDLEVLYDDRSDKSAGEKFADADLLGIPFRIIISKKTLATQSVEIKKRSEKDFQLIHLTQLVAMLQ